MESEVKENMKRWKRNAGGLNDFITFEAADEISEISAGFSALSHPGALLSYVET